MTTASALDSTPPFRADFAPEDADLVKRMLAETRLSPDAESRIDAKAFRDEDCLRIRAFWPEPGVKLGSGRQARLEAELARLGRFAGVARLDFAPGWSREALG